MYPASGVPSDCVRQISALYSDFDFHWLPSDDLFRYAAAASLLRALNLLFGA